MTLQGEGATLLQGEGATMLQGDGATTLQGDGVTLRPLAHAWCQSTKG